MGSARSVREPAAPGRRTPLIPREQGAWAMLLQPFIAALLVYHKLTWQVVPALAVVVLVFLVRDPLTVLARQPWPARPGRDWFTRVRKLSETEADRNTHLWSKVADDPQYRALARRIWAEGFQPSDDDPPPAEALKIEREQIERMAKAVAKLQVIPTVAARRASASTSTC